MSELNKENVIEDIEYMMEIVKVTHKSLSLLYKELNRIRKEVTENE